MSKVPFKVPKWHFGIFLLSFVLCLLYNKAQKEAGYE